MTLYDEKPNQVDAEEFKDGNEKKIAIILAYCGYGNISVHLNDTGYTQAISAINGDGSAIRVELYQWLVRTLDGTVVAMDPSDFRRRYRATPEDTAKSMVKKPEEIDRCNPREVNQLNTTKGITS
jgi:hypothetical protein